MSACGIVPQTKPQMSAYLLNFLYAGYFQAFSCPVIFFFKIIKKIFQENHQCQTVWKMSQRFTADNTNRQRLKIGVVLGKVNCRIADARLSFCKTPPPPPPKKKKKKKKKKTRHVHKDKMKHETHPLFGGC